MHSSSQQTPFPAHNGRSHKHHPLSKHHPRACLSRGECHRAGGRPGGGGRGLVQGLGPALAHRGGRVGSHSAGVGSQHARLCRPGGPWYVSRWSSAWSRAWRGGLRPVPRRTHTTRRQEKDRGRSPRPSNSSSLHVAPVVAADHAVHAVVRGRDGPSCPANFRRG